MILTRNLAIAKIYYISLTESDTVPSPTTFLVSDRKSRWSNEGSSQVMTLLVSYSAERDLLAIAKFLDVHSLKC